MSRPKVTVVRVAAVAAVLIAVIALVVVLAGGDSDDPSKTAQADLQTVSFQKPEDAGPDPFTKPADVSGRRKVDLSPAPAGEQPFGGTGSNRVCDRDKLIRFLRANPERMREWAQVLGVRPTYRAVKRYIAKLHPVTLTRDTQVTNHAFRNGRAVAFQAILQAGTAVLVDKYGKPVVRCFCGNPLQPAVFVAKATCTGCPPHYSPPPQCKFGRTDDYDETYYRRSYYSNHGYDEVFIRRHRRSRFGNCYEAYPDPPAVTIIDVFGPPPPPEPEPQPEPVPEPAPAPAPEPSGLQCNPARSQLEAEQCAEREGRAPENTPVPEPEPPPEPDICHDGQDNEGVPGKIDGEDPNCQ